MAALWPERYKALVAVSGYLFRANTSIESSMASGITCRKRHRNHLLRPSSTSIVFNR
jgi:hypothetical protein